MMKTQHDVTDHAHRIVLRDIAKTQHDVTDHALRIVLRYIAKTQHDVIGRVLKIVLRYIAKTQHDVTGQVLKIVPKQTEYDRNSNRCKRPCTHSMFSCNRGVHKKTHRGQTVI